jgi:phytoene dehydrogenase-like protein
MNPSSTRVAVVGGGPSGLSAALALVKLGYRNVTVFEQHGAVGGMCASALIDGMYARSCVFLVVIQKFGSVLHLIKDWSVYCSKT